MSLTLNMELGGLGVGDSETLESCIVDFYTFDPGKV